MPPESLIFLFIEIRYEKWGLYIKQKKISIKYFIKIYIGTHDISNIVRLIYNKLISFNILKLVIFLMV